MGFTSMEQTQAALSPALARADCVRMAMAFLISWVHARAAKLLAPRGYMRCPCDTVFSLSRSKHLKSCGSCAAPCHIVMQKAQAQQEIKTQKWQGQRWSTAKEKRSKFATVRGFALPCSLCPCFLLKGRAKLPHQGSKARSQAKPALWTKHSSFVHSANHRARAWGWVMHSTWVLLSCYHCSCHGFCLGQQVCSYKNVQKWCRGSMGPQGPFPVGSLDMPSSFAQKGERVYVLFFLCPLAVEAKQKSWSFLFTFYIVCFYRKNPIKCCFPSL